MTWMEGIYFSSSPAIFRNVYKAIALILALSLKKCSMEEMRIYHYYVLGIIEMLYYYATHSNGWKLPLCAIVVLVD
jgi:hypothetical protein